MRTRHLSPLLAMIAIGLTACASPFGSACTTIGYIHQLEVTLADPRDDVALELCDGAGCQPGPPDAPTSSRNPSAPPPAGTGVTSISGNGETGWTAGFFGTEPTIGYRLSEASGAVIAEGSAIVEWMRVGGSKECGGAHEAELVIQSEG